MDRSRLGTGSQESSRPPDDSRSEARRRWGTPSRRRSKILRPTRVARSARNRRRKEPAKPAPFALDVQWKKGTVGLLNTGGTRGHVPTGHLAASVALAYLLLTVVEGSVRCSECHREVDEWTAMKERWGF